MDNGARDAVKNALHVEVLPGRHIQQNKQTVRESNNEPAGLEGLLEGQADDKS